MDFIRNRTKTGMYKSYNLIVWTITSWKRKLPAHVDYFPTIFVNKKSIRFTLVKREDERLDRIFEKIQKNMAKLKGELKEGKETMICSSDITTL